MTLTGTASGGRGRKSSQKQARKQTNKNKTQNLFPNTFDLSTHGVKYGLQGL